MAQLDREEVIALSVLELNAILASGVLSAKVFDGAQVRTRLGTPLYDLNGQVLVYRLPIYRGDNRIAFMDVAADDGLGGPLLAVGRRLDWNERRIRAEAREAARLLRDGLKYDQMRFVAYGYPKFGIEFLNDGVPVLLLEYQSWEEVPRKTEEGEGETGPGQIESWSFLDRLPQESKQENARSLASRRERWQSQAQDLLTTPRRTFISLSSFRGDIKGTDTGTSDTLHYSTRDDSHSVCFELEPQENSRWCVPASVQMTLLFWRYEYDQTRVARELGLDTTPPRDLPYDDVGRIEDVIERLTSDALAAGAAPRPSFRYFQEITRDNRPVISVLSSHCRVVVGFKAGAFLEGLHVFDPWPPPRALLDPGEARRIDYRGLSEAGGTEWLWEDFELYHSYRVPAGNPPIAFVAQVRRV